VHKIRSLVLVIHGTDDEVIDISHGLTIHNKCQKAADPLWVEGAGHNDVEIYSQYIERLKNFINNEIRNHSLSVSTQNKESGGVGGLDSNVIAMPNDVQIQQPQPQNVKNN
jgi:hypothetical protein